MKAVIDTNVLLVANEQHSDVSPECIETCIKILMRMKESGVTVIDDSYLILKEYRNKTSTTPEKGVGDVFLKHLLQNKSNVARVRSEEHTSELQSRGHLVCRLLLEKK